MDTVSQLFVAWHDMLYDAESTVDNLRWDREELEGQKLGQLLDSITSTRYEI